MNTSPSHENRAEQAIASAMIYQTASLTSKALDTFASWLIAGFGAAVTLLATSREAGEFLGDDVIRIGARYFFPAVIAAVLQKYFSILVTAAASGSKVGAKLINQHLAGSPDSAQRLDFSFVVEQMRRRKFIWHLRWLVAGALTRALDGTRGLAGDAVAPAMSERKQALEALRRSRDLLTKLGADLPPLPRRRAA